MSEKRLILMKSLLKSLYGQRKHAVHFFKRQISSSEVATALRPFYFAVHPDLFGQYPRERDVNENSLKHLMAYLESIQQKQPISPLEITFYLRSINGNRNPIRSNSLLDLDSQDGFREVKIKLKDFDLRRTILQVLKSCNLSTDYLNNLKIPTEKKESDRPIIWSTPFHHFVNQIRDEFFTPKDHPVETLNSWLRKNYIKAELKLEASKPIREETQKLRQRLIQYLHLQDIIWNCGWGVTHFRGCLQSFLSLAEQHKEAMDVLKGRTLVFENTTGVNLDGHVVLSSEDVRNKWLDLIKIVPKYDATLKRIPAVQKTVSRVLRDIQVVHRKFQPAILAEAYEYQLRKLSAALADHWVQFGFPNTWPESLKEFQLVVEGDTGPLMLSPTGQFIVPGSCPAFLIVQFLTEHMLEASRKLQEYAENKYLEKELHRRCIQELGLITLHKDDNITPDKMISFCRRLINYDRDLVDLLRGHHVYVSHYYSVLQEGDICIPWDWK